MFRTRWYTLLFLTLVSGCHRPDAPRAAPAAPATTTVSVVKPVKQTLRRTVEQPGHLEALEWAPLHAKIAGYVHKVHADIGDEVTGPRAGSDGQVVREGQLLAELWVPEMAEELEQKKALVAQARAEGEQAEKALAAARANYETAKALVREAEAGRSRARANFERWESEYQRVEGLVARKVIDAQTRDETKSQFEAARAAREEVEAKVQSMTAARDESAARRDKAEADVRAAAARLRVAEAEQRRLEAMLQYTKVRAPFDGVVVKRHVDAGHLLQPNAGAARDPLFVVARTDVVRLFVEVPEAEAGAVGRGVEVRVRVPALKNEEFEGRVARTSWALDPKTGTLRTAVDLPNPGGRLRPGAYAVARLTTVHPDAWTLPASALVTQGEQSFVVVVAEGNAARVAVRAGAAGGGLVEVVKKQGRAPKPGEPGRWEDFTGAEEVVAVNAASLADGQAVTVAPAAP